MRRPATPRPIIYSNSTVPGIVGSSWANSSYFPRGINDAGAIAGVWHLNGGAAATCSRPYPRRNRRRWCLVAAGAWACGLRLAEAREKRAGWVERTVGPPATLDMDKPGGGLHLSAPSRCYLPEI